MTTTLITEGTASAPVLTGVGGSLIAVLDFCLVTTLGWTKAYSGTNLAAYHQPGGSNGFYLRVDDSGGQNARLVGYETMSAISTGTGPFPTDAQVSGGLYCYKSNAATSAARAWTFLSDGKLFYFLRDITGTSRTAGDWQMFVFGDLRSYKSGDAYHTILIAEAAASLTTVSSVFYSNNATTTIATSVGHYVARAHTQIGAAVACGKTIDYAGMGVSAGAAFGVGTLPYPSAIDGLMHLSPAWIGETAGRRGLLPGIWSMGHVNGSVAGGDTFTGSGTMAGRTFLASKLASGTVVFETSDTWGT